MVEATARKPVNRDAHIQFALWLLHGLPRSAQREDVNRLTLAYFLISSLDLLHALDHVDPAQVIDWVYAQQVVSPTEEDRFEDSGDYFMGFRGSLSVGARFNPSGSHALRYDGGHLASTYSALAILTILGDDFHRLHKDALLRSMKRLQQPDGSFTSMHMEAETDLRFVYCAVAISAMVDDWTGVDQQKAVQFILNCQSYDDGFGLAPGQESHGGATYCAIASLLIMGWIKCDPVSGRPSSSIMDVNALIKWCLQHRINSVDDVVVATDGHLLSFPLKQSQSGGFQGRINKKADTCYAFWVVGSLHLLGAGHLCNVDALHAFLMSCQDKYGGFSKWPGEDPDVLHAYYGICGLSLLGKERQHLRALCCKLGISTEAAERLRQMNNE